MTDLIANKTILTPTSGFLSGYTHSLSPYVGCSFGASLCGKYCYASQNAWITQGRPWGLYGAKSNHADAYRKEYDSIKSGKKPRPLRIFMASSTDPYVPQEKTLGITRSLLQAMVERPPDALVLQTRSPLVVRDADLLCQIRGELWVSMTIETDLESIPGLPPHATSPAARFAALKQLAPIPTQIAIAPLLPFDVNPLPQLDCVAKVNQHKKYEFRINDVHALAPAAERLAAKCFDSGAARVIVDHWTFGDYSMMSDRRGGCGKKPLTMAALQIRIEAGEDFGSEEWGGCGCAVTYN